MNNTRSLIIMLLFSFFPYVLVSWGYSELTHGGSKEFWYALGTLLLVRLFFSIIETLGSILSWRLYGKKHMVNMNLKFLRENNFPKREYDDDLFNYLSRIYDDQPAFSGWDLLRASSDIGKKEPKYSAPLKTAAKEMDLLLEASREFGGILTYVRMVSAARAALDIYSPEYEKPFW